MGDQPRGRRPGAPPLADLALTPKIKLAFLSGTEDLNRRLIEHLRALYPELPLWVVADFPPEDPALKWIRYRGSRFSVRIVQTGFLRLAGSAPQGQETPARPEHEPNRSRFRDTGRAGAGDGQIERGKI